MKRLQVRQIVLRVCVAAGVLLSGLLITPYVALPFERISWQRFAGVYVYAPETPTPVASETPTSTETATATGTATGTMTETPTGTATSTDTPTGTMTETTPSATGTVTATSTQSATATGTATGPLPDLVVSGMQVALQTGNSCNYSSTALGIRVSISNQGAGDVTSPFTVEVNGVDLRVDGSVVPAGGTISLWVSGYNSGIENTVVVDSLNEVQESNETNNTRSEMLPIPTLPAICTPTSTPGTPSATAASSTTTTTPTATSGIPSAGTPTPTGTSPTGPTTTINYTTGKPGSFFNVTASNFPPNTNVFVSANGQTLATLTTDSSGLVRFTISSNRAAAGTYTIAIAAAAGRATATTNGGVAATSTSFQLTLDNAAPLRLQQGTDPVIALPFSNGTYKVYLPGVVHS